MLMILHGKYVPACLVGFAPGDFAAGRFSFPLARGRQLSQGSNESRLVAGLFETIKWQHCKTL